MLSHSICVWPLSKHLWSIISIFDKFTTACIKAVAVNWFLLCPEQASEYNITCLMLPGKDSSCKCKADPISHAPRFASIHYRRWENKINEHQQMKMRAREEKKKDKEHAKIWKDTFVATSDLQAVLQTPCSIVSRDVKGEIVFLVEGLSVYG
jgi:hypothetical protein